MKQRKVVCGLVGLTLPGLAALAQQAPPSAPPANQPSPGGYVTREEYDKLKAQLDGVVKSMAEMKQEQAANQKDVDQVLDEIQKDARDNHRLINDLSLGTNKVVLAGDGSVDFSVPQHGNSTFAATFSPLMLYELDKNLLFEGALDISGSTDTTDTSSTTVDLVLANITYTATDWLYVGAGVFAVPFGNYHRASDAPWINLLPDDPLVFGDRAIAPSSETGFFAGGACPIFRTQQIEYNAYVTNGPNLITDDPAAAGSLNFDDFTDLNGNKAVGGRIGWLPTPQFDIGYSIQYSQPAPSGFSDNMHALLQAVDAIYKDDIQAIKGTVELRGEWVWSNVGNATYDPTGALGFGPLNFNNNRNGGYFQAAYRPSLIGNDILKNFQAVVRWDAIYVKSEAPGGGNEYRVAFGLNYWIKPNVVIKLAYEIDDVAHAQGNNMFLMQWAFGL
jgi:hypothetical protein